MALGWTTSAFSFFIFSAASSRPVFCFFLLGSASACWLLTMNWECSALARSVSSWAFFASGLSFAPVCDLSVAAAAWRRTGADVGVVSVAWDSIQESRDARFLLGLLVGLLVDGTGGVAPALVTCFVVRRRRLARCSVWLGAASVGTRPSTRGAPSILECGGGARAARRRRCVGNDAAERAC